MDKRDLLKLGNVVAVGEGLKNDDGPPAIIVNVTKKLPLDLLSAQDVVPPVVEGLPTDVVEVGVIKAFERTDRNRPALGGDSIGHIDITAGTLGVVLWSGDKRVILSNNHVLANSNNASKGDLILQPGAHDGGSMSDDVIGYLEAFVPIQFDGGLPIPSECPIGNAAANVLNFVAKTFGRNTRLMAVTPQETPNLMDAAIALPISSDFVSDEIRDIGTPVGFGVANLGDAIHKSGRTTGYTTGSVLQTNVMVSVQYGAGQVAVFENQLIAGPMSQPGDSGSAVLNMQNELVGLLFAGSDQVTIFSPIDPVQKAFGLFF